MTEAYTEASGTMINSGEWNGMESAVLKKEAPAMIESRGLGKKTINYKLRDWVFSRQRYWGEPIPIIHCPKCGNVAVPEEQLPLKLPGVESYQPTGTGESPLAAIDEWVNCTCPQCGGAAKRETNTMPQWAGSSWYFLRYVDSHNDKELVSKEKADKYLPVDMYIGGVGNEKKLKPFIVSMLFLFADAATHCKSFLPYNIILSQCLPILKGIPDLLP